MTTRSKINQLNNNDGTDSLQRRFDNIVFDEDGSILRRAGSEATLITSASVSQSLKYYQGKALDENEFIESCYRNIFDEFEPSTKKLIKAGRELIKALNTLATAQRNYNDAFKAIRDACKKGQGAHMLDVVNAFIDINNINDASLVDLMDLTGWYNKHIVTACENNLREEHKKSRTILREYQEGRIQVDKLIKKGIKRSSANIAGLQNQAFSIYAERKRQAENEQRRHYLFVLERHASFYSNLINLGSKFQTLKPRVLDWLNLATVTRPQSQNITPLFGTMRSNIYEKHRPEKLPSNGQQQSLSQIKMKRHSMYMDEINKIKSQSAKHKITKDDSFIKNRPAVTPETFVKQLSVDQQKKKKENGSYNNDDDDSDASTIELPPMSIDQQPITLDTNYNYNLKKEIKTKIPVPPPLPEQYKLKTPHDNAAVIASKQINKPYRWSHQKQQLEKKILSKDVNIGPEYRAPSTSAPLPPVESTEGVMKSKKLEKPKYYARHTYLASDSTQLALMIGDQVTIIKNGNLGWSYGEKYENGVRKTGWFPSSYIDNMPC